MAVGSGMRNSGERADVFGGTLYNAIDYTGPTSYVNGTGDQLNSSMFGFFNGFKDINDGCIDTTGTYFVRKQMASPGGLNAKFFLPVVHVLHQPRSGSGQRNEPVSGNRDQD